MKNIRAENQWTRGKDIRSNLVLGKSGSARLALALLIASRSSAFTPP